MMEIFIKYVLFHNIGSTFHISLNLSFMLNNCAGQHIMTSSDLQLKLYC